jgi:P2 family phage contractile tail tube protein
MPESLHSFNVYDVNEKLIGQTGEITLPNFEPMTETISGAGILGEHEVPITGHFTDLTIEITFRTVTAAIAVLMRETSDLLYLRGGQQYYDHTTGEAKYQRIKITIRRRPKGIDLGKLQQAKMTESKVSLAIYYIKIEDNDTVLIEYDPYNYIYIVNGVDLLAELRSMI